MPKRWGSLADLSFVVIIDFHIDALVVAMGEAFIMPDRRWTGTRAYADHNLILVIPCVMAALAVSLFYFVVDGPTSEPRWGRLPDSVNVKRLVGHGNQVCYTRFC